jgi:beta-1,4-mannosyltransferase
MLAQVLLDAAVEYDTISVASPKECPLLIIVVTGKGPNKLNFLERISMIPLQRVAIRTAWLLPQDYATLLACADLGVSLHASSSDLDLPMKVADMLGWCVLPMSLFVHER